MRFTKERSLRIFAIFLVCLAFFSFGILSFPYINDWRVRGRETSGKSMSVVYTAVLDAHFKEFGEYSGAQKNLPKPGALDSRLPYFFYFSQSDIPEKYRIALSKDSEPILSKDTYRILMIIENRYNGRASFWLVQPDRSIRKLPVEVILDS